MMAKSGIRIVAINGSVRPGNLTAKTLGLVIDELKKQEHVAVECVDPASMPLALPGTKEDAALKGFRDTVAGATGVILATPEYHGSYSSVIKLVIENLGYPSVLSGKPIGLLGVASGQIGAIKALEHLRSVCSHIGAVVLPSPVSVAGVHKYFDDDGKCLDPNVEKRVRGLAANLLNYIRQHICPKLALEEIVREG